LRDDVISVARKHIALRKSIALRKHIALSQSAKAPVSFPRKRELFGGAADTKK
jgi:hypothetical protein